MIAKVYHFFEWMHFNLSFYLVRRIYEHKNHLMKNRRISKHNTFYKRRLFHVEYLLSHKTLIFESPLNTGIASSFPPLFPFFLLYTGFSISANYNKRLI